MRTIKFRAWDTKTNKYMEPWPEGFHLFGETTCFDLIGQQFADECENRLLRYNDIITEQYTGIKDKNGVEIYEGDILRHNVNTYEIKWSDERQFVAVNPKRSQSGLVNWRDYVWLTRVSKHIRVIGNIHENSELLDEQG